MRIRSIEEFGPFIDLPIRELTPLDVLYDFEGPRIFSADTALGRFLCYVVTDFLKGQAVLVTPTNQRTLELLLTGGMTVRAALISNWAVLVRTDHDGRIEAAVSLKSDIPDVLLPKEGTMLHRSLQPLLSIKLEGADITETNVRASVVRQALDAGTVVLKRIVDIVWDANPEGRPKNALRLLSDLPAQSFAFGSFQVDFKKPTEDQLPLDSVSLDAEFQKIGQTLDRLITWASSDEPEGDLEIQELRALEKLVPPLSGQIESVTISGLMLGRAARKTLTRVSTQKLRRAMRAYQDEQVLRSYSGRIRQLDMDSMTFRLRDIIESEKNEVICSFDPDVVNKVGELLLEEHPVTVTGRQVKGSFEVSDISIFVAEKRQDPTA